MPTSEQVADKDERFEFVDGHAVAMGIPSDVHQRISKRLTIKLEGHLSGRPYEVLQSAALWTGRRERAPDIMVLCKKTTPDSSEESDRVVNSFSRFSARIPATTSRSS